MVFGVPILGGGTAPGGAPTAGGAVDGGFALTGASTRSRLRKRLSKSTYKSFWRFCVVSIWLVLTSTWPRNLATSAFKASTL